MDFHMAHRLTRWGARTAMVGLTTSAIAIGSTAFAQQSPATQSPAVESQQLKLIYSSWTKFCFRGQETNGHQVCFTGEDGKVELGPVVSAMLIDREGETKKSLRIILPLGMQLPQGTRVIIDRNQPMNAPYLICFPDGCMADYEVNEELISNMKKGQWLVVQGFNNQGQGISLFLPLSGFGKAYDGPAGDPSAFAEQRN